MTRRGDYFRMSVDDVMQRWGRKFLGITDDVRIRFSDDSAALGGCDTCGYGGTQYYRMQVGARVDRRWIFKEYEGGFLELIEELTAMREEN
jgi:hypothetical protein